MNELKCSSSLKYVELHERVPKWLKVAKMSYKPLKFGKTNL